MHYAFLAKLIPEEFADEVRKNSFNTMQDAASALELHIHEGLCANLKTNVPNLNVLPISSFPKYYKKCFVKSGTFSANGYSSQTNIGFCNLKGVRNKSISFHAFKCLDKWCSENKGDKTIFIYTISASFMVVANRLKKKYADLKICAIIADLPNMSSLDSNKSFVKKISVKLLSRESYSLQSCVDFYVLLTRQMADYMHITKPWCVMEGIATKFPYVKNKESLSDDKIILYAGTLHEKFGVKNLVDAFELIPLQNYKLVICGVGDSENYIKDLSRKDSRIVFLGQQPRAKVLELIKMASVLVNPRQNNEEFTKYSFPSKNLEYLSSGIPFVAYKLDGIPNEYDEYINYIENDSLDSLKEKLVEIAYDCNGSFKNKALQAVQFVLQNKSSAPQTKRILDLCLLSH